MTPLKTTSPSRGLASRRLADSRVLLSDRDQLSRRLRISLVDHCNFRCFFCHNEGQGPLGQRGAVMSPSQITRLVTVAVRAGVREVKLTGGEPMLYRHSGEGIVELVRRLNAIREEHFFGLSMTTNGLLLERHAEALAVAGLDRVTISLHTLREKTLQAGIYGRGSQETLDRVLAGAGRARQAGLTPLKVNTVIFAESEAGPGNIDEIGAIAEVARALGAAELRLYTVLSHERFSGKEFRDRYLFWSRRTLLDIGAQLFRDKKAAREFVGHSERFTGEWRSSLYPKPVLRVDIGALTLALEAMEDQRFAALNLSAEGGYALRVSAAGVLRGALEGQRGWPLLGALRRQADDDELEAVFREARQTLLPSSPPRRL